MSIVEPGTFQSEAPSATNPRFTVSVNNEVMWDDLISVQIELASFNVTGIFEITALISRTGDASPGGPIHQDSRLEKLLRPHLQPKHDTVDIFVGYPITFDREIVGEFTLLMSGVIDRVYLDWTRDVVRIVGRDKSALFADNFVHAQFRNQTVAGVVQALAEKHGLSSEIIDSGTLVGSVFDDENIANELNPYQGRSEWDILTEFASLDGYAVFVIGDTLHYRPVEESNKTLTFSFETQEQGGPGNIDALECEKNFGASSGRIGVEILSTKIRDKEAVLGKAGAVRGGDAIVYTFVRPNLDADLAQALADALLLAYTQFELLVSIHTTGAPQQDMFSNVQLNGTGSIFDTLYRIVRIRWSYGIEQGWRAEIDAVHFPAGGLVRTSRKGQSRRLGAAP